MSVVIVEDDAGTKAKLMMKLVEARMKLPKYVEKNLDKIWEKVRKDAQAFCPVETGTLRSTIRTTEIPMGAFTGGWTGIKAIDMFNRSIIAGDLAKINPKSGLPCNYAVWVHDGHKMRDGSDWGGIPFLTEALAANMDDIEKAIQLALVKVGKEFSD